MRMNFSRPRLVESIATIAVAIGVLCWAIYEAATVSSKEADLAFAVLWFVATATIPTIYLVSGMLTDEIVRMRKMRCLAA